MHPLGNSIFSKQWKNVFSYYIYHQASCICSLVSILVSFMTEYYNIQILSKCFSRQNTNVGDWRQVTHDTWYFSSFSLVLLFAHIAIFRVSRMRDCFIKCCFWSLKRRTNLPHLHYVVSCNLIGHKISIAFEIGFFSPNAIFLCNKIFTYG